MRVQKTEVTVRAGVEMTAALVSDLHGVRSPGALDIIRGAKPDFICCAGDMFDARDDENWANDEKETPAARFIHKLFRLSDALARVFGAKRDEGCFENALEFMRECARVAPTFYAPGNHDRLVTDAQRQALTRAEVAFLCDSHARISENVHIGGISGLGGLEWLEKFDKLEGVKILLSHKPEHFPRYIRKTGVTLTLSGHAHGGQWRVFGRGIFAPGQGLFPKYTRGEYENRLVISTGLANTSAFPRLNNPPEVTIIKLR